MYVEHRAYRILRKRDPHSMATRCAGAMYRMRLYAKRSTDKQLALQLAESYLRLKNTPLGKRIIELGRRTKIHEVR